MEERSLRVVATDKTFFNKLYNYRGEAVIKTIEDAINDKWEDAEPINHWQELHK